MVPGWKKENTILSVTVRHIDISCSSSIQTKHFNTNKWQRHNRYFVIVKISCNNNNKHPQASSIIIWCVRQQTPCCLHSVISVCDELAFITCYTKCWSRDSCSRQIRKKDIICRSWRDRPCFWNYDWDCFQFNHWAQLKSCATGLPIWSESMSRNVEKIAQMVIP